MLKSSDLSTEAELLRLSFQQMYVEHGRKSEPRTGLHASSLLVPESEWCARKHVLINLFPEQAKTPELHSWDWKLQAIFDEGWKLHERWQNIFRMYSNVVHEEITDEDGLVAGIEYELDRTHYDETREVYFSPDAILEFGPHRYVVEIKGIKQESFLELTDNLETAIQVSEVVAKACIQANLYMHFLGLKRAILLIENKNDQSFKVWVIEHDPDLIKPYRDRWYAVKGNTQVVRNQGMNKLKPRVCASPNSPLAKKCPMREVCFRENE